MNVDKDLISIIIPVYNVKDYLERCLQSVIVQNYNNLEIIIIDDGSYDGSEKICDDFARRDRRILVKHKKNEGQGAARNDGIHLSCGRYIMFVDSDDWIDSDFVSSSYEKAMNFNVDMVISRLQMTYLVDGRFVDQTTPYNYDFMILNTEEALEALLYRKKFSTSPCGILYKRELFKNIQFPVGKIYEDFATIYKVIDQTSNVAIQETTGYHYFQRHGSTIHSKFEKRDLALIEFAQEQLDFIIKKYPNLIKAAHCRFADANLQILWKLVISKNLEFENIKTVIFRNICLNFKYVILNTRCRFSFKIKLAIAVLFADFGISFLELMKTRKQGIDHLK